MSTVIARGTGAPTTQTLAAHEDAQPEGTPMEMDLTFQGLTALGRTWITGAQIATAVADLANTSAALLPYRRWPGQPLAQALGPLVRFRWIKEAAAATAIWAAIGVTIGYLLTAGLLTGIPAIVAAVLTGVAITYLVANWRLVVHQVVSQVVNPTLSALAEPAVIVGAAVLGGVLIWDAVKHVV